MHNKILNIYYLFKKRIYSHFIWINSSWYACDVYLDRMSTYLQKIKIYVENIASVNYFSAEDK